LALSICIFNDDHYPGKGANTISVMRTASAMAEAGARVDLVIPRLLRGHLSPAELCENYGVKHNFNLVRVPSTAPVLRAARPEKLSHGLIAPWLPVFFRADVIYSRNLLPLMYAQLWGKPWVYETYRRFAEESPELPHITRRLPLDSALVAVAHSNQCADNLHAIGFRREAILTAYNGYHPDEVSPPLDKREARTRCGLDKDRPVVLHLGNMDPWIRLDVLLDMAVRIPEAVFLFVGGEPEQQGHWHGQAADRGLSNIRLVAKQPPARVREYLYAADVNAVVPRHADLKQPNKGFSITLYKILPGLPMKLMTYFPTGVPIFAPDYSYLHEVLRNGENAVLYDPRSIDAAAGQLRELIEDRKMAGAIGSNLLASRQFTTWTGRGELIYRFIRERLEGRAGHR
jgi:glycosyltransferase involved in cell wall biosynthesis